MNTVEMERIHLDKLHEFLEFVSAHDLLELKNRQKARAFYNEMLDYGKDDGRTIDFSTDKLDKLLAFLYQSDQAVQLGMDPQCNIYTMVKVIAELRRAWVKDKRYLAYQPVR